MRLIIIIVAIITLSVSAFSQTVSETRAIKITALEVYEKYVSVLGKLYNGNVYNLDDFLSLFEENAILYNDILPENNPQELSPQQYLDTFAKNIKMIYCNYDRLELEFPKRENDKWLIICEFGRDIRFKTPTNYYPRWHFNYVVTITMDTVYDNINKVFSNARIKIISVKEPLTDFYIIENKENYPLEYYGENIDGWDKEHYSRMFSEKEVDRNKISIDDNRFFNAYDLVENKEFNHFLKFRKFKKDLYGFSLNYSQIGLGNNINIFTFPDIKQSNQALLFESFYGLQLAQSVKYTWFLNTKFDINVYQNSFNGNYFTQYNAIDSDYDRYLRRIKISSLKEKIYSFSISLPIGFEYLLRISKNVSSPIYLSLEAGGYAEYRAWAISKFKFIADYTGYYNYFNGVEFNHYYDYGHFKLSNKEIDQSIYNKINNFDYGSFGSIGILYARNKNKLLKICISYKHGFIPTLKYRDNFVISEDYAKYETLLQNSNVGLRNIYFGISYIYTIKRK